jgi:hypothetical protein
MKLLLRLFPLPNPQLHEAQIFRAWRYWEGNVCGAAVAAVAALIVLSIVGGIVLFGAQGVESRLWGAGILLAAITLAFAFLLGKLADFWPYAVEIHNGEGLWVYAPFERFYVPMKEVKRIKWSWLWAGWVIQLGKRRGLLTRFVIHSAWGQQGRELVRAITQELAHSDREIR